MPYGFGRGFGFGFRGASPPWPYVGVGRGGLPRCGYFLSGAAWVPGGAQYAQPAGSQFVQGVPPVNLEPFVAPRDEIGYLKSQADLLRRQLEQIEARIRDIEDEKP